MSFARKFQITESAGITPENYVGQMMLAACVSAF